MKTVCEKNMCAGCMACVEICPKNAISIEDSISSYNAVVNVDECIGCDLCENVCPQKNNVLKKRPIHWYQGWSKTDSIRSASSSGGLASSIEKEFIRKVGCVCSCVFYKGEFIFDIVNDIEKVEKFAGSKYVKSNPKEIYKKIKKLISEKKKVLFVGLPCQVAGIKNYIGDAGEEFLYTIDLICHGTPSPQVLDVFLKQHGYLLKDIKRIKFRLNNWYQIYCENKTISVKGTCDAYITAFLNSICYTENCYSCSYAQTERVADLTLGDSWGSELQESEIKKGISLVLCQTKKGEKLLDNIDLNLFDVNIEKALEKNDQLCHPADRPKKRDFFMHKIKDGKSIEWIVTRCYLWITFKQYVKGILIRIYSKIMMI